MWNFRTPPSQRRTLDNGLRILAVHLPATHRQVLLAQLEIGSRFEGAKDNGISHFLEHMLYRGTEQYPSAHRLALAFERLGGSLQATTAADTGTLELRFPPENFTPLLPIFADVFCRPLLGDIEIERGIVREELLEGMDDEGRRIDADDLIRGLVFRGHPLGQPITGSLEHLSEFSVEGLRVHHERFYTGLNTVLVVAGPLEPERVLDSLESTFHGLVRGNRVRVYPPSAPTKARFRYTSHLASQTDLRVGFRGPGWNSPEEPSVDLLLRILDDGMSTRLYHRLCDDKGLCYDVSGGYESYADSGLIELAAETGHDRVEQVLGELLELVVELKEAPPTEEELAAAKKRHLWELERMLDDPATVAEFFASEEQAGSARSPLERHAQLEAVTPDDVQRVARQWLTGANLSVVLVGSLGKAVRTRLERQVAAF